MRAASRRSRVEHGWSLTKATVVPGFEILRAQGRRQHAADRVPNLGACRPVGVAGVRRGGRSPAASSTTEESFASSETRGGGPGGRRSIQFVSSSIRMTWARTTPRASSGRRPGRGRPAAEVARAGHRARGTGERITPASITVLELADVPRPTRSGRIGSRASRVGITSIAPPFASAGAKRWTEMADERLDVLGALPQRRDVDRERRSGGSRGSSRNAAPRHPDEVTVRRRRPDGRRPWMVQCASRGARTPCSGGPGELWLERADSSPTSSQEQRAAVSPPRSAPIFWATAP